MVELIELTKDFGKVRAVDRLSFTINKGEIFGLLGENGAGKTTTLRMLATMLKPTSGTAIISGLDITKEPEKVRRKIGILFGSESGLYARLTARENIEYFGLLHDMDKNDLKKRINELAEKFGMQDYIDKPAGTFSKGMKQKVCFVRSVIHNPEVMLFDEPTNSLDVSSAKEVHDFIRLCKQEGRTIIFSSHSMSEVEKLCDRVVIIHKGKLVALGSIDEIKQRFSGHSFEDVFLRLVGEER
ncbi:ABC transporter related protein [Caldicellulosiruptor kronotskyensis 2002]|uniref:ABC transporter related protein n=1 Tax=Caldicellulosiruptor kronotskyensis (strain DSM 18902 / VKM B-2412 / 2002) TaxID=632348 RepID=E4SCR6_CALK2|nr:ATP-binding cassette domain-containing protein [Caldicellulosiruptor kronotskyensis]ADQ45049.1 ABC transporter related protein [Caldicellulosiruptor kronotskyensis 2002]